MKTLALIQLTFKESLAKKTFLAFFGISTLISLLFIFALNLDIVDGAQAYISVFGQETNNLIELDKIVGTIEVISSTTNQGRIKLGQCAGCDNKKLTTKQLGLIEQWFLQASEINGSYS